MDSVVHLRRPLGFQHGLNQARTICGQRVVYTNSGVYTRPGHEEVWISRMGTDAEKSLCCPACLTIKALEDVP